MIILTWMSTSSSDESDNEYLLGALFLMGIVRDTAPKALWEWLVPFSREGGI